MKRILKQGEFLAMDQELLFVENLKLSFRQWNEQKQVLHGVNFSLRRGETFAIVGETGSGKTLTALSIMELLPLSVHIADDSFIDMDHVTINNKEEKDVDLFALSEIELEQLRGDRITMIFQEPMTALNPVMTIGEQIAEILICHHKLSEKECRNRVPQLLAEVGIANPTQRARAYPHQLSGGMKQRVLIAMALASKPDLLIADEPTTALDVTIQAQILSLIQQLKKQSDMAMLLISHDLAIVRQIADRVLVMFMGHVVEEAPIELFFSEPKHPYTLQLFAAIPDISKRHYPLPVSKQLTELTDVPHHACSYAPRCRFSWDRCFNEKPSYMSGEAFVACHLYDEKEKKRYKQFQKAKSKPEATEKIIMKKSNEIILDVKNISVHFPLEKSFLFQSKKVLKAVDDVSFKIKKGTTVAVVGESGCGKTTLAKAILRLTDITSGDVFFENIDLSKTSNQQLRKIRQHLQVVFQDPFSAMNPRILVGDLIAEGIKNFNPRISEQDCRTQVIELLQQVGLSEQAYDRYPHEFSGGQRQRINIARALALQPKLIICDEPTSALDVSVQAQILNLLRDLQQKYDFSYLFISHNLGVVSYLADETLVMYLGKVVEQGTVDEILNDPKHPYTKMLLQAVPSLSEKKEFITTEKPLEPGVTIDVTVGCSFRDRCPQVMPVCATVFPNVTTVSQTHSVSCYLYEKDPSHLAQTETKELK